MSEYYVYWVIVYTNLKKTLYTYSVYCNVKAFNSVNLTQKMTRFFYVIGIILLGINIVFHLLTYIPDLKTSNASITLLLGISTLITFGYSIKLTKKVVDKSKSNNIWNDILKAISKKFKIVLIISVIYVFFNFFFSLLVLSEGYSPKKIENEFVLESKGNIKRIITEEEYYKYKAYEFRGISGHFVLFQLIGVAMLLSKIKLNRVQNDGL